MADYLTTNTELTSIADAIRTKGGTSSTLVYPTEFVSGINAIHVGTDVSDTTATESDVMSGKYFYNSSGTRAQGNIANGTITNNTSGGTSSGTINRGSQIKIGAGYYGSDTYYTAQSNSGTYTVSSSGTKTVNGYYYVNVAAGSTTVSEPTIDSSTGVVTAEATVTAGYQRAQTKSNTLQLTTQAAKTYNVSSSTRTISAGTYLTGAQTIRAVTTSNITAANIKDGTKITVGDADSSTRIKNVTGTFTDASTVSSGQTAATAEKILSGYSAWVDGSEVKGSISSKAATTYYTSSSDQTISSGQYLSGTQTIKAVTTSNLTAANIKSGVTVSVGDSSNAGRIKSVTGTLADASSVTVSISIPRNESSTSNTITATASNGATKTQGISIRLEVISNTNIVGVYAGSTKILAIDVDDVWWDGYRAGQSGA